VLAGVFIWLLPPPVGVSLKAWHLLAHFIGTIVGIITSVRARPAVVRRWLRAPARILVGAGARGGRRAACAAPP
jgi:hypothetical protein